MARPRGWLKWNIYLTIYYFTIIPSSFQTLEIGVYSMMTDVWSYGVLCWEIYSEGAEPYPGMSNQQARAQVSLRKHNTIV
jgi:hypothetical protein